jgi:2-(1,2-epoxy-1,2-dihydrophenyl)acetyl-CoA isomerase
LAAEIAGSAPLAICSIRRTMRGDLAEQIRVAIAHEAAEHGILFGSADFREGVAAATERREPSFSGN